MLRNYLIYFRIKPILITKMLLLVSISKPIAKNTKHKVFEECFYEMNFLMVNRFFKILIVVFFITLISCRTSKLYDSASLHFISIPFSFLKKNPISLNNSTMFKWLWYYMITLSFIYSLEVICYFRYAFFWKS